MKFFARINEEQVGPLSLTQLVEAGVRPSDYIWHKGMADWERAEDVPEVCRAMRRYLAGFNPETGEPRFNTATPDYNGPIKDDPDNPSTGSDAPRMWIRNIPAQPDMTDYNRKPQGVSVIAAICVTLLCFPLTGLAAIWFAMQCSAHWKLSCRDDASPREVDALRRKAHNDARIYKMMLGITICIGIMMFGFALFRQGTL